MSERSSFLDLVLEGRAQIDEIDDFVEEWHRGQSKVDLSDYLGLKPDECSLWLDNPEMLSVICSARRGRQSLAQAVNEEMPALRRAGARVNLSSLLSWLRRQGVEA